MTSADATSAAHEYKLTLSELTSNNKTQINLLTILADDYRPYADAIVDSIHKHIYTVPAAQKLLVMYVCDSILKNVKDEKYKTLFGKILIEIFLHVFKAGDEKVRAALYKLRITWSEIFLPSMMYRMDIKVHAEDQAWPISNPQTGALLRNDPKVTQRPAQPQQQQPLAAKVHVNRKFIAPQPSATKEVKPSVAAPSRALPPKAAVAPPPKPVVAAPPRRQVVVKKDVKKEPTEPAPSVLDKLLPPSFAPKAETSTSNGSLAPKRKAVDIGGPKSVPPKNEAQASAGFEKRRRSPIVDVPKDQDHRLKDQDHRIKSIRPTEALGSHAFAAPPPMMKPPQTSTPPPFSVPPPTLPPKLPTTPIGVKPTGPIVASPAVYPPPMSATSTNPMPFNGPSSVPMANPHVPPPNMPPPPKNLPKPIVSSDAVKLNIPQNNRIFVDQKAYEVIFIDDAAVIERQGQPHRIYFAGPPRNVIIDGVPHMLKFGEAKTVFIDGHAHVIRFGAPSREFYMGNFAFKGQFGGPPIRALINDVSHEIRLTGSAPEVKIDPEPSYELGRFLNKMRAEKQQQAKKPPAPEQTDPFNLLKKLQRSGYLKPSTMPEPPRKQVEKRKPLAPSHAMNSPSSSSDRVEIERRPFPPSLKEFNIRLLKVRYDSVVDALLKKREDSCKYCGLRLDGMPPGSEAWTQHMDWHVKRNLSKHESTNAQPWYPTDKVWLKPKVAEEVNENDADDQAETAGVIAEDVDTKHCASCGEKFEEFYDEDEEKWRLRDSVQVHGKTVHKACERDFIKSQELNASMTSLVEEPTGFEAMHIKKEMDDEEDVEMKPIISSIVPDAKALLKTLQFGR